jgi:hypothetical protein
MLVFVSINSQSLKRSAAKEGIFFLLAARVGSGADSRRLLRDHFHHLLIKLPAETN